MAAILEQLKKLGEANDCSAATLSPTAAKAVIARATGRLTYTDNEEGAIHCNHTQRGTERDDDSLILVEDDFDRHVRKLVSQAGGAYKPPKHTVRIDPELKEALTRLEANQELLLKAARRAAAIGIKAVTK